MNYKEWSKQYRDLLTDAMKAKTESLRKIILEKADSLCKKYTHFSDMYYGSAIKASDNAENSMPHYPEED